MKKIYVKMASSVMEETLPFNNQHDSVQIKYITPSLIELRGSKLKTITTPARLQRLT